MPDRDSRDEAPKHGYGRDEPLSMPGADFSQVRPVLNERLISVKAVSLSAQLVQDLFDSISPDMSPIVEGHLVPALTEGVLFDIPTVFSAYHELTPFWLRQERTLRVGPSGLRESLNKVSVVDFDEGGVRVMWDISKSRRRLGAFDVAVEIAGHGDGRWTLAERVGEVLGLGSVTHRLARVVREQQEFDGLRCTTVVVPGVFVVTARPETPEERAVVELKERQRLKSGSLWCPSVVEVSEPLYGEIQRALNHLDPTEARALISSGFLRFADNLVGESRELREGRLAAISRKMERDYSVLFGRTLALGKFELGHPLHDSAHRVDELFSEPGNFLQGDEAGDEASFDEVEREPQADGLTSVEIQGVRSEVGDCVVAFHSASQEQFLPAIVEGEPFEEERPVLEVRLPELREYTRKDEAFQRSLLAQRLACDVDRSLKIPAVVSKIERSGVPDLGEAGLRRGAQYSSDRLRITFEGAEEV